MSDGQYVEGSYFFYAPNKGAAGFFAIAFAGTCLLHLWQCYHYRFFKVTGLFIFCGLLFVAGFAIRLYGAYNYDNLPVFVSSICLVYASPPLLELANYHILGRILYYVPYLSPLHPGRVLSTFAFLSMIIEMLNGWGASYTANASLSHAEQQTGHNLMKASLILQIVVIACFLCLASVFYHRCRKNNSPVGKARGVRGPMVTLYISVTLILARTIYRLVEHFGFAEINWEGMSNPGDIAPVIRYEWYFYVFESSLMLVNMWMWNLRHPRRYLPSDYNVYLARDGVTEIEGPGWKDPRSFWMTVVDPFDIVGIFRGNKGQNAAAFWERDDVENKTGLGEGGKQ